MSESNRQSGSNRHGVTGIVIVLIVGLVMYVFSSGPAIWLIGRCGFPEYLLVPYEVIYKPLEIAQRTLPSQLIAPFNRYIGWWMAEFISPSSPAYPATPSSAVPIIESDASETASSDAGN